MAAQARRRRCSCGESSGARGWASRSARSIPRDHDDLGHRACGRALGGGRGCATEFGSTDDNDHEAALRQTSTRVRHLLLFLNGSPPQVRAGHSCIPPGVELSVVLRQCNDVLARLSMRADCPVSCLNSGIRASRAYAPSFYVCLCGFSIVTEVPRSYFGDFGSICG